MIKYLEVLGPVVSADRLDHLHAVDGVVAAWFGGKLALVPHVDAHAVGHAGMGCPVASIRTVFGHVGHGVYQRAPLGSPHRQLTPSGADLQHSGSFTDAGQV